MTTAARAWRTPLAVLLCGSLILALALVIGAFLWLPVTPWSVYFFVAAAIGVLWLGTVPLSNGIVGQIFGVHYVSLLFGIVFLSHQVGSFLGVWLGGYFFDLTGSYNTVWLGSIALGLAAAALNLPIDDRPVQRLQTRAA